MMWTPQGETKRYATDCGDAMGYYQRYPVPVAAALWCGVPPSEVPEILKHASEVGRGIVSNSFVRCLEPKCRALHEAIEAGELPVYREQGGAVRDHVAPDRRHVARTELREWISKHYPDQRPSTLFDETERAAHTAVSVATVQALQAERDGARADLEKARANARTTATELSELRGERDSLAAMVDKPFPIRERDSLLKLVIGMAIKGYTHDPAASKSNAPKEIADDLASLGMPITDDTVRKYLKQAADTVLPAKQGQL
jgi:hypothetical protein